MSDSVTVRHCKIFHTGRQATKTKVPKHLATKAKICISISIIFRAHKADVAKTILWRERQGKPVENFQGSYTAPFVGSLRPVEISQHAQVITASSTGAVLQQ